MSVMHTTSGEGQSAMLASGVMRTPLAPEKGSPSRLTTSGRNGDTIASPPCSTCQSRRVPARTS